MKKRFLQALCVAYVAGTPLMASDYSGIWSEYLANPDANQHLLKELVAARHVGALRVDAEHAMAQIEHEYQTIEAELAVERAKLGTHQVVNIRNIQKLLSRLNQLGEGWFYVSNDLRDLEVLPKDSIKPTFDWCDNIWSDDGEGQPAPIEARVAQELEDFTRFVGARHKQWLESLREVEALPTVSLSTQRMRCAVVEAMKSERNRLNKLNKFLAGKASSKDKLSKRTQYEVVEITESLVAMSPTYDMLVGGHMDELEKLQEKIFALLWGYDDMLEPSAYYHGLARQFLELHDQGIGINEYQHLKGRMGGLMMAQPWLEKYFKTVECDIDYDPDLMRDAIQVRIDQYRVWFINRQAPEYANLFAGSAVLPEGVRDFIQLGQQFVKFSQGKSMDQMKNLLNQEARFTKWSAYQNYFCDYKYSQTFWVIQDKPYVIRMHKNNQGKMQWTFGLLAEHPYFSDSGARRSNSDIIGWLRNEHNEIMKFVSDGTVSMVASSRYPSYSSVRWMFPEAAKLVQDDAHKVLMP